VLSNILRLLAGEVVGLGVGGSLSLVTNDVIPVGGAGIDDLLEELGNEGSREREDEWLVVLSSLLGELHNGRRADSEVETTDVVDLSVLNELPDLGLLQMVKIIVVGSTEVSAQASVVTSDDGTATASLLLRIDTVLNSKASSLDSIVKNGRVLVVTSTTDVDDTVGRKDVLGASSTVLSSTAGNELGIVVVEEILVERDVLLLSKDSIVGLEAVLVQKSLITLSLDVYKRPKGNLSAIDQGGTCWCKRVIDSISMELAQRIVYYPKTGSDKAYRGEGSPDRRGSIL
jgi:hypothetical protein